MKLWGLLLLLHGVSGQTYAAVAANANCKNAVGCAGYYRAFGYSTSPATSDFGPPSNVTGISAAAIGATVSGSGGTGQANIDVAGFRFKNPADTSDGANNQALSFYFGYLGASGTWTKSTQTANMNGALAEVVAALALVSVYYEYDNVPGFKWDITQTAAASQFNIYDCTAAKTSGYDCVDVNAQLNVATDLEWSYIDHTKVQCNTIPALSSYPNECEIHSLTTTGSLPSNPGVAVITVTLRVASQPVTINGVAHGPDRAKWDLQVNFPYANYPNIIDQANARLAVVTLAAGKADTFTGTASKSGGTDTVSFQATGATARSYYSYSDTCTVDGGSASIYTQVITGKQIADYKCALTGPCANILASPNTIGLALTLKAWVGGVALYGWQSSLAIHAIDSAFPKAIEWDPETGAGPAASSAILAVPSIFLALLAVLLL